MTKPIQYPKPSKSHHSDVKWELGYVTCICRVIASFNREQKA